MKIELPIRDAIRLFQLYRSGKLGIYSEELSDITSINFKGINAPHIDLCGVDLSDADFTKAHLQQATLIGGRFNRVIFSKVNLSNAILFEAELVNVDFRGALLNGADLRGADLRGADLRGAKLDGANFEDAIYDWSTKWPRHFNLHSSKVIHIWEKQSPNIWKNLSSSIENLPFWRSSNPSEVTLPNHTSSREPQVKGIGRIITATAAIICVVFIGSAVGNLIQRFPSEFGSSLTPEMTHTQAGIVTVLPPPTVDALQAISQTAPVPSVCVPNTRQLGVTLFYTPYLDEVCIHLVPGEFDLVNSGVGDNTITSVTIVGNYKLTLITDSGLTDEIYGSVSYLDERSFGGHYSSARVEELASCPYISKPGLYLYSERGYEGNCIYATSDVDDFGDTLVGGNGPRSIRIVGDFVVTMYEDIRGTGRSEKFVEDQEDLTWRMLGDQYSSVRILNNSEQ